MEPTGSARRIDSEQSVEGEVKLERRRRKKVELGEAGSWDLGSGLRLKERERQRRSLSVLEPPDLRIQFCATSSRSCAVYKHQTGLCSVLLAGSTG